MSLTRGLTNGLSLGLIRGLVAGAAWSPLRIEGLTAWFDAADASTVTAAGGAVSSWASKGPSGITLDQPNAALRPSYGSVGGHLTVSLNEDYLTGSGLLVDASEPFTIVVVARPSNYDRSLMAQFNSASPDTLGGIEWAGWGAYKTILWAWDASGGGAHRESGDLGEDRWGIYKLVSGGLGQGFTNREDGAGGMDPTNFPSGDFANDTFTLGIGSSMINPTVADFRAIVGFQRVLTEDEMTALVNYLRDRHGVPPPSSGVPSPPNGLPSPA